MLCDVLGVSRNTLREAFSTLSSEHIITTSHVSEASQTVVEVWRGSSLLVCLVPLPRFGRCMGAFARVLLYDSQI
ncbi:MAG: GntR family transcriptional regulator [Chloroflexota bacterium]|nr:GntR family transcriptional regulator [Chloroflexota bacterium]